MKMPKILFFIAGMAPTGEESVAAMEIGAVAMRNVSAIDSGTNPEACDGVAGEYIPPQYRNKPVVKSLTGAINLMKEKQKMDNANAADELANRSAGEVVGTDGKAPSKETPKRGKLGGKPAGDGSEGGEGSQEDGDDGLGLKTDGTNFTDPNPPADGEPNAPPANPNAPGWKANA